MSKLKGKLTHEYIQCSGKFTPALQVITTQKDSAFYVKGFASIEGVDRHNEEIDPRAFDVETFLKNPQLWYNHDLYYTSRGVGPIGVVESMYVVQARASGEKQFDLIDLNNGGSVVDTISADEFLIKDKEEGLWVVAKVMEPDVIAFIADGRLNAFSWSGSLLRKPSGKLVKIDIREVSLVFLPANARALFVVGKDAVAENLRYVWNEGLFFELKSDVALSDSSDGSRFLYLLRSSSNHTAAISPKNQIADIDSAKAIGKEFAKDVSTVVLMENEWKKTPEGHPVYKAIEVFETGVDVEIDSDVSLVELPTEKCWSQDYINALPNNSFALVSPDGSRFFAYRDRTGKLDHNALKNAIREASTHPLGLRAVKVFLKVLQENNLSDWLETTTKSPLTNEEQRLLGIAGEAPLQISEKGGEEDMKPEELTKALTDALSPVTAAVGDISKRLDALETKKEAEGTTAPITAKKEEATSTAAPTVVKTEVAPAPAVTTTSAPVVDESSKALEAVVTKFTEQMGVLATIVKGMESRIAKMEGESVPSRTVTDSQKKEADTEVTAKQVEKALAEMTPEKRKQIQGRALDNLIMGPLRKQGAIAHG